MNIGIAIGIAGLAMLVGAGGRYLYDGYGEHAEAPKTEERVLPKDSMTFGPVPQPVPHIPQDTLTVEAMAAKARQLVPPVREPPPEYKCTPKGDWNDPDCPKAEEPKAEPKPIKAKVHVHRKVRHHAVRHRRSARPAARLKSKWAQQQPASFSLERLFNARQ